jgi:CHASE3 domain sensor protein
MAVEFTEDHLTAIIETRKDVQNILKELKSGNKCMDDHEARLNNLDAKENQRIGAERNTVRTAAIVAFIISSIISTVAIAIVLVR